MKIGERGIVRAVSHEVFFLSFPLLVKSSEEDAQCQDHSSFRTEWEGRISSRPRGKSPRRTAKLCGGIYQRPDTNQAGFVYKTKLGRVVSAGDAAEQTDTRDRSQASISFSSDKYIFQLFLTHDATNLVLYNRNIILLYQVLHQKYFLYQKTYYIKR